jgi:drug/metabolite transporter (DMT)-like permease
MKKLMLFMIPPLEDHMANVVLGISLMLIATTMMNIGQVIQKKAVDMIPPLEDHSTSENVKGVLTSKLWVFGWILTTLAMVFNFLALGHVDISITQPLIAWGLVVLVIFSRVYLKEEITKKEAIGIGLAVCGVILLGITADFTEQPLEVDEILGKYIQVTAIICFVVFYIIIASLWASSIKAKFKNAGVNFAIIAGVFSVLGLTFSKGSSQAIAMLGVGGAVKLWWVWVLLLVFMIHSTMAIATQQMSYQKGKSVIVTPIFNMTSITLPIFTGFFVFGETVGVFKIISMVIIVAGAFLLSYKKREISAPVPAAIASSD